MRFLRILALVALCLAYAPTPALAVTGYDSAYSGESAFVTISPGQTLQFQVFFSNTGTLTWTKGGDTQVDLAACLADKVTCPAQDPSESTWNSGWLSATRYTTSTQATVAPGTLATFAYNIKAPSNAGAGVYRFNGDLVVSTSGARIHPEGYYQDAEIQATGSIPQPTPTPTPPVVVVPPPVNPTADLSITKSDSPDPVNPGTNLTYTLTASNAGGYGAQNAMVTDVLPANTTFVSFSAPAGWSSTTPAVGGTGTVTATNAFMSPASVATFTLVVMVSPNTETPSTITNTAAITSSTTDPNPANNSATATTAVRTGADLAITKSDSPDPVNAGFNITYTINAANAGPNAASNVVITDAVPAGTTFVSFTAPAGWTATTPAVGSTGTVTATMGSFASAGNATFTLVVEVNPNVAANSTITNTAAIASDTVDQNSTNNSASATTTVTTQSLLCFDGTTDTANGETGDQIYGGVCTLTGARSATLNNVPPGRDGAYSGVYFSPSALSGQTIGQVSSISFAYTGSVLEGNGPRFSIPIDNTGDGVTDFYAFVDARDCNNDAGLVDVINDTTCTIFWTGGPVSGVANWATLVGMHSDWTVANSVTFVIADGPGAWNLSDVHMGN